MHELDLDRLFLRAQNNLTTDEITKLGHHGISFRWVGVEPAAIKRGGTWARAFEGERLFITPCRSPVDDDICDLIAFRLETPKIFWRYTGQGAALGYWNAVDADYNKSPIYLHESPYYWLKSGYQGTCILDWKNYWAGMFGEASSIRVENIDFGKRVSELLARPFKAPPVEVRT